MPPPRGGQGGEGRGWAVKKWREEQKNAKKMKRKEVSEDKIPGRRKGTGEGRVGIKSRLCEKRTGRGGKERKLWIFA